MIAYVDSSIWINRIEGWPEYQQKVEESLSILQQNGWTLCASEAVLLNKVLFKPYRDNQHSLVDLYTRVFTQIDILKNYNDLLRDALVIAQNENLRAMDAIHVAFASHYNCDTFITTDDHFRNLKILPVYWIELSVTS